ncbi:MULTISPECIES: 2-phosphosulfolactate phosphatase family protein [Leptolyngbya]|jgi:2-phosphosulfolactate phosphatase|uniref:Probable 2-phosphosulfolactate phosphatase n=2 Tax=Leptolyngbya boryana TaxID=1184 RepID=A0A1Z4JBY5_LEPBY|nr:MULTISPECIES: 2-phosphosulfolactate phosphatase family protein [Leptolyngbya]BAY54188.1 2-phosphosulfolactate phosphatase [Leptolyngbya boryana NIES-2135]MBD1856494.1 2-phosphosulfolactate phosphatase family protein [Leptolyngbya sp. FACHB-1624]MBD2370251.1 2-phosphosulfolactate phosphatase family protein [Leptolyngbya sp. FACHB-161]MBD2376645.1 2-phosphosulfolactate phosphatase family protein [Leptolyngbya sp. FACHB-238]MBD2400917.1 2-phosphosulfolactate phosphatase family protein [Leptoly
MKFSVFHTPELTPTQNAADCAIAIDVLRATSTIATALSSGADAVHVFSDMDKLMHQSEALPPEKRLRAGERGGSKVEGCDLGNSPLDCTPELMTGRHLFISTTNGTRALQKIQASPTVLAAALINRKAVVDYLVEHQPETVWIVGAGWEGSFALEDTVCAGAIVQSVAERLGCSLEELIGNDEMVGAISLYQQWKSNLLGLMYHASHGKRLLRLDCLEDLKYCASLDTLNVLPIQREIGTLVKHAVVAHAA